MTESPTGNLNPNAGNIVNAFLDSLEPQTETSEQIDQKSSSFLQPNDQLQNPQKTIEEQSTNLHYDYYAIPPNIDLARIHGKSCRLFKQRNENIKDFEFCKCCKRPVDLENFKMNCRIKDFNFYGVNLPMFFHFMKFNQTILVTFLLISGFYDLISNVISNSCEDSHRNLNRSELQECSPSILTRTMIINKFNDDGLIFIGEIVHGLAMGIAVLLQLAMMKTARNYINSYENEILTPSSFTLMVENLPDNTTDDEVQDYLHSRFDSKLSFKVLKIIRAYEIREYVKLLKKRETLTKIVEKNKSSKKKAQLERCLKEITTIESKQVDLKTKNCVLVTFSTQGQAKKIAQETEIDDISKSLLLIGFPLPIGKKNKFKNKTIFVSQAPDPCDIVWENLGLKYVSTISKKVFTSFLSIFLIGASVGVTFGLASIDGSSSDIFLSQVISNAISIVLFFVNQVIEYLTKHLSEFETHASCTRFQISIATRLSYMKFINTALVVFVINLLKKSFWQSDGLGNNLFYIFLGDAFLSCFWKYFDVFHIYRIYKRRKLEKSGAKTMTQSEANELYKNSEFEFVNEFSEILKMTWLACFYGVVFPLGLIMMIMGLFIRYKLVKHLLITRFSAPLRISSEFSIKMMRLMLWGPFFFLMSGIFFQSIATNFFNPYKPLFIILILFLIFYMNPCFFSCINKITSSIESRFGRKNTFVGYSYDEVSSKFQEDYETANPATKAISMMGISALEKKGNNLITKLQSLKTFSDYILTHSKTYADRLRSKTYQTPVVNFRKRISAILAINAMRKKTVSNPKTMAESVATQKSLETQSDLIKKFTQNIENSFILEELIIEKPEENMSSVTRNYSPNEKNKDLESRDVNLDKTSNYDIDSSLMEIIKIFESPKKNKF